MPRIIATFLLLVGTLFAIGAPTALAAPALVATVQQCDGLNYVTGTAQCLPLVEGSPALGGGVVALTQDWYTSGTGECAGSVSCLNFTGSANSFANFGAMAMGAGEVASFVLVPILPGSGYTSTTDAWASFADSLHFSTGTQARFTFTVAVTQDPGCGTAATVGFNCDTTEVALDAAIHIIAGPAGNLGDAAFITLYQQGTDALQFLDELTGSPPALPHWQSTSCRIGSVCGELMTDLMPIAGPLALQGVLQGSIRPYNATAPNTIGASFSMQVVLSKIDVVDAGNNPVTSFAVTSDSGAPYPLMNSFSLANRQLAVPVAIIGAASYSNMIVTVGNVVSGPSGTSPQSAIVTYDPVNQQLTIPAVILGSNTFYNVVATVSGLVSVGAVAGADSFDGTYLHIPSVQVQGGPVYNNVVITPGKILGVANGMPRTVQDQYSPQNKQLLIPAVEYAGKVYTNATITVGTIVSVNGKPP